MPTFYILNEIRIINVYEGTFMLRKMYKLMKQQFTNLGLKHF